jgi:hypothetical protein
MPTLDFTDDELELLTNSTNAWKRQNERLAQAYRDSDQPEHEAHNVNQALLAKQIVHRLITARENS